MIENRHQSSYYDVELQHLRDKVLSMGRLVESQARHALVALNNFRLDEAQIVLAREPEVDAMDVAIDGQCSSLIVLRQPTARDLRFVIAVLKTVTNLERAGDEAARIAYRMWPLTKAPTAQQFNIAELKLSGEMALSSLRRSVDALIHLDVPVARAILPEDELIDREFQGFVRKISSYMAEDPRSISASLDFLFIAKAIERIGDHAKNIAEFTIYAAEGTDVRHRLLEEDPNLGQ